MDYWQYRLITDESTAEILMALMSDAPFDTFEETAEGMNAYMPADAEFQDELLDELAHQWPFTWSKVFIPGQNWNEEWERHFHPVQVGSFCGVRAHFHPPFVGVEHELIIHPKMAFGTGHHETTWMCMAALEYLPVSNKHVLDYGCGTGILGILAARLGAAHVEAIDIQEESYLNTIENAAVNGVAERITARCGTIGKVQSAPFDLILANINRNVILQSLSTLKSMLKPKGIILASGFLDEDEQLLRNALAQVGLFWIGHQQRGRWLAAVWAAGST
ncbi:MAG: 50S ribosomal protein L11 methyltransferase [Saprospiraceae bacterium]